VPNPEKFFYYCAKSDQKDTWLIDFFVKKYYPIVKFIWAKYHKKRK